MLALPRGDAFHDEQPLAGLDVPDPPRVAGEGRIARRPGKAELEALLLGAQRYDLGQARLSFAARLEVARDRSEVQESHHDHDRERNQEP
jgi:hypothetical protein